MNPMSKMIALTLFSVLIGLGVIASTRATHLIAGMKSQVSLSVAAAAPAEMFYQFEGDRPHGCHSESYYDPADD
jgi:hypothetical protein